MRLNNFEKFIVTNNFRNLIQMHWETAKLAKLSPELNLKRVLEIGSADGNGLQSIDKHFNVEEIHACELDFDLIKIAHQRLEETPETKSKTMISSGDAADLAYPDNVFDATFCYGVLHHIPNWEEAIKDIARVTKSGALFFIEEFYRALITSKIMNALTDHPQHNRFNHAELVSVLENEGFEIIHQGTFFNLSGRIIARKK